MDPTPEIRRLLDIMPASGRMYAKIVSKPEQPNVIVVPFPRPWSQEHPIVINFDLWRRLSRPQRDLVILQAVSWLGAVQWFKLGWPQVVGVAGIMGAVVEAIQADALGVLMATGLGAIALTQIWRENRSDALEVEADTVAVRVAQRRGYTEQDAANALLSAIETIAALEGRTGLSFTELLRCQNLRAIAGLPTSGVPNSAK